MSRTRGRPKGTRNGKRLTTQWEPKKWKPLYESVVVHHIAGHKNTVIAKSLKCTPMAVSLIINSVAGRKRIEELRIIHEESLKTHVADRIESLHEVALKNVEKFINNKDYATASPIKHFDRSLKILQVTGAKGFNTPQSTGGDPSSTTINQQQNNLLLADAAIVKRMLDGFGKLEEIKKLHGK